MPFLRVETKKGLRYVFCDALGECHKPVQVLSRVFWPFQEGHLEDHCGNRVYVACKRFAPKPHCFQRYSPTASEWIYDKRRVVPLGRTDEFLRRFHVARVGG